VVLPKLAIVPRMDNGPLGDKRPNWEQPSGCVEMWHIAHAPILNVLQLELSNNTLEIYLLVQFHTLILESRL
jgi:hypothetical protein